MTEWILAFDFGGTKLTAALLPVTALALSRPSWAAHKQVASPTDASAAYDLVTMTGIGQALLAEQQVQRDALAAVGVSFGGPVDFDRGVVRLSHHVPGWEETPLQAQLEAEFGVPARVDNDANVAALGEWRFGAGRGVAHLCYITISTGVGGGWLLDGRSWRGHSGMAGEIGHTVVDPAGPICLCGKRGCVERLASGPFMAQDFRSATASDDESVTGETVAVAAATGNETARRILLRGAAALGTGIGNAANLVNPEMFILGGGVTKAGELWWGEVRRAARATALPEVEFRIETAAFQDDAPLWGAVALVEELAVARGS